MAAKPQQRLYGSDDPLFPSRRRKRVSMIPCQTASAARTLDRKGFTPLYSQIQRALTEKIDSGELREGDLLASEWELACAYQVSRVTARQALHGLKISGYASSQRGRGTFVDKCKAGRHLTPLRGFTEDILQRGRVPASRLLEQEVVAASTELAANLKIEVGSAVMRLRRLRLANGTPMAVETTCLALRQFPGIERIDFVEQSLYQTLLERFGVCAAWAAESIEILAATREESLLLEIPVRASVLSISKNTVKGDGTPIEETVSRYRGDVYRSLVYLTATTISRVARI